MGKREALAKLGDELIAQMERAELEEKPPLPTISEFCAGTYRTSHGCSDRTWEMRKYKVAAIMEDLGDLRLDELTTARVAEWLDRLAKEGAPLTSRPGQRGEPLGRGDMWNDLLKTLRAICNVAVQFGHLESLPFNQKTASVVPIRIGPERIWTPTKRQRLLSVAATQDRGIYYMARFMMLTGCRPGELLPLEWTDVLDVPTKLLRIRGKRSPRGRHQRERIRYLPLYEELADLLIEIPRVGPAVFPTTRGDRKGLPLSRWPQKRWERIARKANVPTNRYDLRHTFITEVVAAGVPIAMVAEWCGNSARVIEERYLHLQPGHLDTVAKAAADAMQIRPMLSLVPAMPKGNA